MHRSHVRPTVATYCLLAVAGGIPVMMPPDLAATEVQAVPAAVVFSDVAPASQPPAPLDAWVVPPRPVEPMGRATLPPAP